MRYLLLLLLATNTHAETLSNDDVIALYRAGISAEVIVQKIGTSDTAFDTSATALITLKAAGVPDVVITAMLQAKPSAPKTPRTEQPADTPLPAPHFTEPHVRPVWAGACKFDFYYNNDEIFLRSSMCRNEQRYRWSDIAAVCFTFWEKHPGKPRQEREPAMPTNKAEVHLFLRNGRVITLGNAATSTIETIRKDFDAGYPEIIRCDDTYD